MGRALEVHMGWRACPQRKAWLRPCVSFASSTLQLLLEHQDWIAPGHHDPLHELLEDLGELPTVADLVGACWGLLGRLGACREPEGGMDRQVSRAC